MGSEEKQPVVKLLGKMSPKRIKDNRALGDYSVSIGISYGVVRLVGACAALIAAIGGVLLVCTGQPAARVFEYFACAANLGATLVYTRPNTLLRPWDVIRMHRKRVIVMRYAAALLVEAIALFVLPFVATAYVVVPLGFLIPISIAVGIGGAWAMVQLIFRTGSYRP